MVKTLERAVGEVSVLGGFSLVTFFFRQKESDSRGRRKGEDILTKKVMKTWWQKEKYYDKKSNYSTNFLYFILCGCKSPSLLRLFSSYSE